MLILPAFAGLLLLVLAVNHQRKRHGTGPLIWRFLSGHSLDGIHRTNAGWLYPGTKVMHVSGRASRWHHLPRLHRAGIRSGSATAVTAWAWFLARSLRGALLTAGIIAVLALAAAVWLGFLGYRRLRHHRMWVAPLHRALAPQVGLSSGERASSWLNVERDRSAASITLPSHFPGHQRHKDAVVSTVAAKLALESPSVEWALEGPRPVVRFISRPAPPPSVTLDDLRSALSAARETDLVLGLGKGSRPVVVSLDNESPHVMLSQGSGSGKSTTGRLIGAQMLHKGAVLMVWDFKRISQTWCKGLPNVAYCRTAAEIHAGALWVLDEIERRNAVAEAGADVEGVVHANVGPRVIVLAEELNATMNRLRAHWRQVREPGDPERSPAVEAIEDALFMGRQVRVNIVAVAQKMSVRASASGEARENMGIRILGRYTASAWKMLVPEVSPMPPASPQPGRIQVVVGSTARETQVGRLTGHQAREFAMSGEVAPWPSEVPGVTGRRELVSGPGPADVAVTVPPELPEPETIRLSDAVHFGVLSMSLAAARKASHRPGFPEPAGWQGLARLYDLSALEAWDSRRRS